MYDSVVSLHSDRLSSLEKKGSPWQGKSTLSYSLLNLDLLHVVDGYTRSLGRVLKTSLKRLYTLYTVFKGHRLCQQIW